MDITALKRIEAQLEHLARHDTLTGLPNRRHFEERLSEFLLQSEQESFALMYLDIDHFKTINDAYGHATGDAALKYFSECLRTCVRGTDTIARLAGDEFVVLLPGASQESRCGDGRPENYQERTARVHCERQDDQHDGKYRNRLCTRGRRYVGRALCVRR
jgi:GGDEF domain-containing protein